MKLSHKQVAVPSLMPKGIMWNDQIIEFPNVQDMHDTVHPHTDWSSTGERSGDWLSIDGYDPHNRREELPKYVRKGYGADEVLLHNFGAPAALQLGRVEPSMAGGTVNVPLYLSGDPQCMMAPVIQDKPVDSLSITVPGIYSANISGRQMKLRAAAIAGYLPKLIDHGISVHLYSYIALKPSGYDYGTSGNERMHFAITKVFSTDHAYDPAEVFLGCGSPVFGRYLAFAEVNWICNQMSEPRHINFENYGYPFSIGGGSRLKKGAYKEINLLRERVEMIMPTTHVIHMPDSGNCYDPDGYGIQWHYDFVSSHIEKYLGEQGMFFE